MRMRLFLLLFVYSLGLGALSCECDKPVKPPIVQPPTRGTLVVLSTPSNAPVYLDGSDTRKATPAVLDSLGAWDHTILLRRGGGYDDWTTTVRVRAGVTDTVRAVLVPASASVALSSEPDGAQIWRGNVNTGKLTPDSLVKLEAGPVHTIGLIKQYFQPWDTMLTVEPQSRRAIHVVLRYRPDAPGKLAVSSDPSGASIYLDGVSQNRVTPYTLETVATGSHTIGLRLTGYRNWDQSVTVNPGITTTVHAVLERRQGRLSVSSTPDSSLLWLDGVSTSRRTPVTIDSLVPKTYAVKLTRTNYRDWTQNVTVLDGQTATVSAMLQVACPGDVIGDLRLPPFIQIVGLQFGSTTIQGVAGNVNTRTTRVVLYALTNAWYVQPFTSAPYTTICGDGTWKNTTHPWKRMVALMVDSTFVPKNIAFDHPGHLPGVLTWDEYPEPAQQQPFSFSSRRWGIKVSEDAFDPGPNYWSDHPENVRVDGSGLLHLRITFRDGHWRCPEVHLLESLGYGTYTTVLASRVDALDSLAVFSPFIYASVIKEFDIEFSRVLAKPQNAQYVIQPYTRAGNIVRFPMPAVVNSTHRLVWRPDRVEFLSWRGTAPYPPDPNDVIASWTYTGTDNFIPGAELFRINHWLFRGLPPASGSGDEVIVRSFDFQP